MASSSRVKWPLEVDHEERHCYPRDVRILKLLLLCAYTAGCGTETQYWLDSPTDELPSTLSELGVGPTGQPTTGSAVPYEPEWGLWTNGSEKIRHVVLPPGEVIDFSDPTSVPTGTIFVKTFGYDVGDRLDLVETRVMWLREDGWEFASYVWNDDDLDGELRDPRRSLPVEVAGLTHTIPSLLQCRACHESSASQILGFSDVQLPPIERSELDSVLAPAEQERVIQHEDAETRWVLGYFQANCVHCHNGGDGPNSSFDLRYEVALDNIIDQPTNTSGIAAGMRVASGDPDASILLLNIESQEQEGDIKAMPPLGVDVIDRTSTDRVRAWIESL